MNKKFYKVTQTQLSSLQSNGFITVDGVRYDYDPNSLYILADPFSPEYRLETQGHNLHLLKDNVIISDLTVPFAQASVYASNAKNLQNKTGSKAYTYYDILPRVDYKDFLLIKDLPMEGILCGFVRNGYFYKVREENTKTDIPFTLFCQTVNGYYSLSTSEITTPIEGYTINNYFNEAKFIPYGTVTKVNSTSPDSNGNVQLNIPIVNNGLLTIQRNGANVATFTANQSGNTTANITVPTKTSELTNDSRFVKNADILLPLSQLSNVRIANLDDALWCADKRFYVIASVHPITVNGVTYPHTDTSKAVTDDNYIVDSTPTEIYNSIDNANIISNLFDGSTDTGFNRYVSSDNYIKIRILPIPDRQDNYSPSGSATSFPHYPYGGFVLTTYYGCGASNVKYACYNKWESQGVGWKFHDCTNVGPKNGDVVTWRIDDEGNYQRTVVDFWFIGTGDTTKSLRPTSIYWLRYRPTNINDENSYFSKYVDEDLVNDVTWKQRGVTTAKISSTGNADFKSITEDGQTLSNKYLGKNEAANYYVQKLGSTGVYKVYMSAPDGKDANRTIATAPIGSSVPIRTKEGHILLPDASVSMPADNEAISAGVADYLYGLDRKMKDFHPTTTLRWLNSSDQITMVINGSWIGFYKGGKQTTLLYPDKFTYLNKNVNWSDLADLVENKTVLLNTVLLNGDTSSIGSYTSVGNGISSALNFAGQNISNTAKGVNSLSLGRLNSVEGAACFAYGNKNIIKGVASIAFGGGNTAGEKIDWTSLDAATNSSSSYCFAIGENNTSIGRTSITIGTANNSKGDGSISIGRDNTIWSKESVAIGRNNYLNKVSTGSYEENEPDQGNGVVAIGTGLKTPLRYRDVDYSNNFYWNCVISGRYNDPYAYNCVRSSDLVYTSSLPPLFTLGNGLSDTNRNNAIVLFHNASAINSDFIYFNEYSIFNKKCEFRGSETIIEGTLKDASGTQYIKGGTITASFINSLF